VWRKEETWRIPDESEFQAKKINIRSRERKLELKDSEEREVSKYF